MPHFFDRFSVIVHDLKSSWYFRVWAVLWAICAVFVFVSLIILGARSTEADREQNWTYWRENATQIEFPGFHFRIEDPTQTITASWCNHAGVALSLVACSYGGSSSNCFKVDTTGIIAINKWGEPVSNTQIDCFINTTGYGLQDNLMLAWALDPHSGYSSNPYHQVNYIGPDQGAYVFLEKEIVKPMHALDNGDTFLTFWRRRVHYESTVKVNGQYYVSTAIETFGVGHFEQKDIYNGWMAMGDVGGFAFFLLILHTIVMLGLGVFLANDSKFLLGEHEAHGGSSAEKSPLVH
jgi:hypothetical protein